jgi:hypothetical protein
MANEQKQKFTYVMILIPWVPKQLFAHNKKIWIATVNYQRIAKNLKFHK